jgi:titin
MFSLSRLMPRRARSPKAAVRPRPTFRPRLEGLEGRLAPAVFTVTSAADDGSAGTLRSAILQSNATPGLDTINFNIAGAGTHTTTPTSPLPFVSDPVILDATTQPGYAGAPLIQLSGAAAGANNVNGLVITAGGTRVQGLDITGFSGDGILLTQNGGDVVANNYVGVGPNGTTKGANAFGIVVAGGASNYLAGNVVATNTYYGITLNNSFGAVAAGNYVGTNAAGTAGLGNGVAGVVLNGGSTNNAVGANVIGSNGAFGVLLNDAGTRGNTIYANDIGLNAAATALPNGFAGVGIGGGASANTVGGPITSSRNVISDNAGYGVYLAGAGTSVNVIEGDYIGTTPGGNAGAGNVLAGVDLQDGASTNLVGLNTISANGQGGVVLQGTGTSGNVVGSCLIGTNAAGNAALANGSFGVLVEAGASGNIVANDLISGNLNGVELLGAGTSLNTVEGCFIGTNLGGTAALAGSSVGVFLGNGATFNTVGGVGPTLRNVVSGNTQHGVELTGAGTSDNVVTNNGIGVNAAGTAAVPNGDGVFLTAGASGNRVVGNVLAGNGGAGAFLSGAGTSGNVLTGNLIGTADGKAALPNQDGVVLTGGASNNTVGGAAGVGGRNVISGNSRVGVNINGAGTVGNLVIGNYVGVAADGTSALGNGLHGVLIYAAASGNTVGGVSSSVTAAGAGGGDAGTVSVTLGGPGVAAAAFGNFIAFNGGDGVLIGTDTADGFANVEAGTGNAVLGNSIYGNAKIGIDLGNNDGVTPNGFNNNQGPNNYQNYPVLTSATASGGSVIVMGTLHSASNTTYRVELFANAAADPSGHGQGKAFLGYVTATTDGNGNATFAAILADAGAAGQVLSATATDPLGNTSEFSADVTAH